MVKFFKRLLDQRGVIHLLPLLILLAGIIGGVYLVQKSGYQIFGPKAAAKNIEISASEGKDANGNPCFVREEDGRLKTNCPEVKIKFTSPLETQGSSDTGPNMSVVPNIVKTAYAATLPNGYCKDDKSKIYYRIGSEEREARFCRSNEECTEVEGGADCVKTVEVGGRGWVCKDDTLHKDPDKVFFIPLPWTAQNISCSDQGLVCKQEGNSAGCVEKEERPRVPPPSAPTNLSPKDGAVLEVEPGRQIIFEWSLPDNAKDGRFIMDSDDDSRKHFHKNLPSHPVGADCGSDFSRYFLCVHRFGNKNAFLDVDNLQDGATYTWRVDALDENGNTIGTSQGTQITIRKQAPQPISEPTEESEKEPTKVSTPRLTPRVAPAPAVGVPTITTPAAPTGPTICNSTAAVGMPSADQTPTNYKWTIDCSSSCRDTAKHSDCPQSQDQFVCPSTSNWCYDFAGDVGKRCLKLEYIGTRTGVIPPGPGGPACPERPAPAGAPAAPAGVGPTAPQQPVQAPQRVTTGYRFAEDRTQLANLSFSDYTPGGVTVTYQFADPATGPHSIHAQFQYNNSSSDLSEVFTVTIELVGPSAPATQPPPPPAEGEVTPPPPPSAGETPAVLYVGQLRIAPNPVKKDSSGNYPKVRFTVVDANKPWQIYYQNKEGANCGGSCDLNGWTPLNAIEGAEGGAGVQGTTAFAWTPPSYITGTHTIALIDVQAGQVISPVDVVFQDRRGSSGSSSTTGTNKLSVSQNPVNQSGGSYSALVMTVTAAEGWKAFYNNNEGANCGGSCSAATAGWTAFDDLQISGFAHGDSGTNSFSWTPPAYVSGTHTLAIFDQNTSRLLDSVNVTFSSQ